MDVKGITAIVTGGASGLGAATSRRLAEAGAMVGILDVDGAAAAAVADELGGASAVCDVADELSTETAVAALVDRIGPPRLLVNCAGIQRHAPVVGDDGPMPLEIFRQVVNVNLVGTFNVLRLAAAAMVGEEPLPTGERGVIVNVASIAAFEGQPLRTPYCAAKGGVVALTLPLARELAVHGIRVMTIAPGHFATPLDSVLQPEQIASHRESLVFPNDRFGQPTEFAELVLHICANPMLNGETIRIDAATRMPKH